MLKMPYTEKNIKACNKFIRENGIYFLLKWAQDFTHKNTIYRARDLELYAEIDNNEIKFVIFYVETYNSRIVWRASYGACLKYMNGIEL